MIDHAPAGQRGKPCLDVGRQKVAKLAVDLVHPLDRVEQPAAFFVQFAAASVERVAELLLAVAAVDDAIKVESGKRLPLAFQQGKHLPQGFGKRYGSGHYFTLSR